VCDVLEKFTSVPYSPLTAQTSSVLKYLHREGSIQIKLSSRTVSNPKVWRSVHWSLVMIACGILQVQDLVRSSKNCRTSFTPRESWVLLTFCEMLFGLRDFTIVCMLNEFRFRTDIQELLWGFWANLEDHWSKWTIPAANWLALAFKRRLIWTSFAHGLYLKDSTEYLTAIQVVHCLLAVRTTTWNPKHSVRTLVLRDGTATYLEPYVITAKTFRSL